MAKALLILVLLGLFATMVGRWLRGAVTGKPPAPRIEMTVRKDRPIRSAGARERAGRGARE